MNNLLRWVEKPQVQSWVEEDEFTSEFIDYLGYNDIISFLKDLAEAAPVALDRFSMTLTLVANLPNSPQSGFNDLSEIYHKSVNPPKIYLEHLDKEESYFKNTQGYYKYLDDPFSGKVSDVKFSYDSFWYDGDEAFIRFVYATVN